MWEAPSTVRRRTRLLGIARQESEDITRETGGDLGYISEDQEMDPVMKEALMNLKLNEVSEPVENNLLGAYHVVQVTEILEPRKFEEVKEQMKQELEEREPDQLEIQEALRTLRNRASIRIFGLGVEPIPKQPTPINMEAKK